MNFEIFVRELKRDYEKNLDLRAIEKRVEKYEVENGKISMKQAKIIVDVISGEYDLDTHMRYFIDSDNSEFIKLLNRITKGK